MTFIGYKTANNIVSYLSSAISSWSTNIIVNDGWIFPSNFPYLLTIEQQNANGITTVREIVKATAKSWNTITIERAVEQCVWDDSANPKTLSQIAHSFDANSEVSLCLTAWTLQDIQNWINDNTTDIQNTNDEIDTLENLIQTLEDDISNL